jgi:FkbM family methyltransferase
MQWLKTKTHFGPHIWVCLEDQGVSRSILHTGRWEPHVEKLLHEYTYRDITFLDVGANVGYFSLSVASKLRALGSGRVIAVEANPLVTPYLMASVVESGLDDIIDVLPYAVSEENGLVEMLAEFGDNLGGSTIRKVSRQDVSKNVVPCVKLDDVLDDAPHIDIMKMDIEGAELLALHGMKALLIRHKPDIIMEVNKDCLQGVSGVSVATLANHMKLIGYEAFDFFGGGNKVSVDEIVEIVDANNYYDFLFRPK